MSYTIIDSCTGCSACESRCPTAAIHGVKKELYYIDPALCIDCGACGAVCPDDAILDTYGRLCEQLKAQQQKFVEMEQRLTARIEQFRNQKEMVKAQYNAAQAQVQIH